MSRRFGTLDTVVYNNERLCIFFCFAFLVRSWQHVWPKATQIGDTLYLLTFILMCFVSSIAYSINIIQLYLSLNKTRWKENSASTEPTNLSSASNVHVLV